jgi:hypothetical protein
MSLIWGFKSASMAQTFHGVPSARKTARRKNGRGAKKNETRAGGPDRGPKKAWRSSPNQAEGGKTGVERSLCLGTT